jgi:cytochrome c oxidase cbb3-type subunit I/II
MPNYPWLLKNKLNSSQIQDKMKVMQRLGVPYTDAEIAGAPTQLTTQAEAIVGRLKQEKVEDAVADREIIALISYLQRLGADIGWRQ